MNPSIRPRTSTSGPSRYASGSRGTHSNLDGRFKKLKLCYNITYFKPHAACILGAINSPAGSCAVASLASLLGPQHISSSHLQEPLMTTRTCHGLLTRRGRGIITQASNAVAQYDRYGSPVNRPQPWQMVSAVCAVAMLLCNFHRSVFTALLPLVAGSLALTPSEVGLVQSSMLWGYLAGQVPAGRLADERGGDRVLLGGLALWSLATAATAAAAAAVTPGAALWTLLASRAFMGLFSAVIMPSVSAVTAQWVPPERKAATMAMIYAFFNLGGVLGFIVAPNMAGRSGGWPAAFVTAAAGGLMWSVLGSAAVARAGSRPPLRSTQLPPQPKLLPPPPQRRQQQLMQPSSGPQQEQHLSSPAVDVSSAAAPSSSSSAARPLPMERDWPSPAAATVSPSTGCQSTTAEAASEVEVRLPRGARSPSTTPGEVLTSGRQESDPWVGAAPADDSAQWRSTFIQIAALCWCHGVIGWGFFVLQAWVPMYLQSLGVADLANAGLLASLPWLAAAFTATAAGGLADRLVRSGCMIRLTVRRTMHAVSTLGCAVAVLPLALAPGGSLTPLVATLCLVAAVGCYGFSFGGFHAYVQDVAAADAGQLLGLTNTASILGGIAGNLATGAVLQATNGYGEVFWVAAALYATSWVCFQCLLKGEPISLAGLTRGSARSPWA